MSDDSPPLVCTICGTPWPAFANVCQCGGFSTWGTAKGAIPSSFTETPQGLVPRPISFRRLTPGQQVFLGGDPQPYLLLTEAEVIPEPREYKPT